MRMPDLIEIKNGEQVKGTFSAEEMTTRLAVRRGCMAENGIDYALFTSYHNINYFADFIYCSFGRDFALVEKAIRAPNAWMNGADNKLMSVMSAT